MYVCIYIYIYIYYSQRVSHNLLFDLTRLHNKSFDNPESEINKYNIFYTF